MFVANILPLLCVTVLLCESADSGKEETVNIEWSVLVGSRRLAGDRAGHLPEVLSVAFKTDGTQFRLQLHRNRGLVAPTARHTMQRADGSIEEGSILPSCFYSGNVHRDAAGRASLSTCGGEVSGLVVGHGRYLMIESDKSHNLTAPAIGQLARSGNTQHKIRRLLDSDLLYLNRRVSAFIGGPERAHARRVTTSGTKYLEVLAVNDHSRYVAFGGYDAMDTLVAATMSVMNAINTLFNNQIGNGGGFDYTIEIILIGQHTFIEKDPWEDSVVTNSDNETSASSLLSLFNSWSETAVADGSIPSHDQRSLLSGRDFTNSTVGYAAVGTLCTSSDSSLIAECPYTYTCSDDDTSTACAVTLCSTIAAHELGHNFGMYHDHHDNDCDLDGFIMNFEYNITTDFPSNFSNCSAAYLNTFLGGTYITNGECMENEVNVSNYTFCGNGYLETGEECDCGYTNCTDYEPFCNGTTCQFTLSDCTCSRGSCCNSTHTCQFLAAGTVCRSAVNTCDIEDTCTGYDSDCPDDVVAYPGTSCSDNGYSGLCYLGSCTSLGYTCASSSSGSYELGECSRFMDDCGMSRCHSTSASKVYDCAPITTLSNGTPCWNMNDAADVYYGLCLDSVCTSVEELATIPYCGNGGIDFGEECDCGGTWGDNCCNCTSCQLKSGNDCSALEECCDNSTCTFRSSDYTCRSAIGSCDIGETCTGSSGVCPSDIGYTWGTACTAEDGNSSTCYAKTCLASLDQQCYDLTGSAKSYSYRTLGGDYYSHYHSCTALMCCESVVQLEGNYTSGGTIYVDPYTVTDCSAYAHYYTRDSTYYYTTRVIEGSMIKNTSSFCRGDSLVGAESSCSAGQYLEASIGSCLSCYKGCNNCSGPSAFDCTGSCKYGMDSRGMCALSVAQATYSTYQRKNSTTISTSTVSTITTSISNVTSVTSDSATSTTATSTTSASATSTSTTSTSTTSTTSMQLVTTTAPNITADWSFRAEFQGWLGVLIFIVLIYHES